MADNESVENNPQNEDSNKCCCKLPTLSDIYIYWVLFLGIIFSIVFSGYFYFAFYGILSLTIYLLVNKWLSLFTMDTLHMVIYLIYNFSEFGLFFVLFLICFFVIKDYFKSLYKGLKGMLSFTKDILIPSTQKIISENIGNKYIIHLLIFFILLIYSAIFGGLIFLLGWGLWNNKSRFIISAIIECLLLFSFFFMPILVRLIFYCYIKRHSNKKTMENRSSNELDDISTKTAENNLDNSDNNNDNNIQLSKTSVSFIIDSISHAFELFIISTLDGMHEEYYDCKRRPSTKFDAYRLFLVSLITALQLLQLELPVREQLLTIWDLLLIELVKFIYLYKITAYNIIFTIFNPVRTYKSLKEKKIRIIYLVLILLYIVLFILFLVFYCKTKNTKFTFANKAIYIENNQKWLKLNGTHTISPEGFCLNNANLDDSLQTADFAMLTTLPRLYGITDDGKCYLKPSMRGLFNSTMKYIFGKDYENDNIQILCKKLTHYPILIITSDKMLNSALSFFSNDKKITLLKKQFNIKNKNFFDDFSTAKLPRDILNLLNKYKNCVSTKGTINCDDEWDEFAQNYWPTLHSDKYEDIKGFEKYQINIEPNMIIQPNFITSDGKLWAGTHYIVGGSYEDQWGLGFYIETIGRQYIPLIFNNLLIIYNLVKKIAHETFLQIDWLNTKLFYFDVFTSKETPTMLELYSQFNFSHQSLFTIGHSITGATFKSASFYSDIRGIAFESMDSEANINFLTDSSLKSHKNPVGQIINVYSSSSIFTGYDKSCDINAVLPKRYKFPNVYDTACLTAISCSNTQKYLDFCLQTLAQKGKNPIQEFNKSFNAYLEYYGYA